MNELRVTREVWEFLKLSVSNMSSLLNPLHLVVVSNPDGTEEVVKDRR